MSQTSPSSAAFFEAKYRAKADPWDFSSRPDELYRYDEIIACAKQVANREGRYRHAFEPGCSVGVLTEKLAALCEAVDAVDFSETAAAIARERCRRLSNVRVTCGSIADGLPADQIDLLVLSEIGYYFAVEAWRHLSTRLVRTLASGATVLAAHWLGVSEDHCISGDEVHEVLCANPLLELEYARRYETFRLERWRRR